MCLVFKKNVIRNQCLRTEPKSTKLILVYCAEFQKLKDYHFRVKKNSWTLTECQVLKIFESPRLLTWRTSVSFTTWPWHHLRRRIKLLSLFPVPSFFRAWTNFAITDSVCRFIKNFESCSNWRTSMSCIIFEWPWQTKTDFSGAVY